jgi:hypothetical protein
MITYFLTTNFLWGRFPYSNVSRAINMPEPMMVEEENNFDSVWYFNVDVDNVCPAPSGANSIARIMLNMKLTHFQHMNMNTCMTVVAWPPSTVIVEGSRLDEHKLDRKIADKDKVDEIDSMYNIDIVQFAPGESGLDEFLTTEKAILSKWKMRVVDIPPEYSHTPSTSSWMRDIKFSMNLMV